MIAAKIPHPRIPWGEECEARAIAADEVSCGTVQSSQPTLLATLTPGGEGQPARAQYDVTGEH
jgi:hypothetical protein